MAASTPNSNESVNKNSSDLNSANTVNAAKNSNPAAEQFTDPAVIEKQKPINLLPDEFKPKKSVLNLSKKLNKFAIASLVIFFVAGVLVVVAVFLLSNRVNTAKADLDQLKSEVSALEQSEQQIILIKDRITKINQIDSGGNSLFPTVQSLKEFNDNLPNGFELVSAQVTSKQFSTEVTFESSSDLTRLLANTVSQEDYKLVRINSLRLDPGISRMRLSLLLESR